MGQWWEDSIVPQEPYWRKELGKAADSRGLEKVSQGGWWTKLLSFSRKRKTALCLFKKRKKKSNEKAPKASVSSSQAACMTLAVTLSKAQFFLYKIKLTVVPLSDRTQLLAVLRKYSRTRTENGFSKIQQSWITLIPSTFPSEFGRLMSLCLRKPTSYPSHKWSECCCRSSLAS